MSAPLSTRALVGADLSTDHKALRRGQRALGNAERAKQSFLAAMSHELRTPLNAIIGFAEIMDAELLGPVGSDQYKHYMRDILLSARCVLQIVDDVLEISRAETGELVLNKREVDLHRLIDDAMNDVRRGYSGREYNVRVDIPPDLVVQVDSGKMQRVLACLLSNAVKFSPSGSSIRVAARLKSGANVEIVIEDSGIGMSRLAIEQAFAPFVQLDDTISRLFDGAGLGLPLARLLAELHGGSVELASRPGQGTRAIVTLPSYSART